MSRAAVVDLTSSPPDDERASTISDSFSRHNTQPRQHSPSHATQSFKRRRLNNGSLGDPSAPSAAAPSTSASPPFPLSLPFHTNQNGDINDIEAVDLTEPTEPSEIVKTVRKQQEDAVKAQQSQMVESRSTLTAFKCPVCMDTPVDATSTLCGHLFCHKCIIDTLRFGEERRAYEGQNKTPRGNCPVCRKPLSRVDTPGSRRNLIPLQLKLATRKTSLPI